MAKERILFDNIIINFFCVLLPPKKERKKPLVSRFSYGVRRSTLHTLKIACTIMWSGGSDGQSCCFFSDHCWTDVRRWLWLSCRLSSLQNTSSLPSPEKWMTLECYKPHLPKCREKNLLIKNFTCNTFLQRREGTAKRRLLKTCTKAEKTLQERREIASPARRWDNCGV